MFLIDFIIIIEVTAVCLDVYDYSLGTSPLETIMDLCQLKFSDLLLCAPKIFKELPSFLLMEKKVKSLDHLTK